jgi:hypothetical protein
VDGTGGKVPARNCQRCSEPNYDGHDRNACPCLLCHGFYSATKDPERLWHMLQALPAGYLAVRTGQASGIVVIDAESPTRNGRVPDEIETYGVGAVERWNLLTGWDLPITLQARTVSGGLHLFYALPSDTLVRSRDAKATKIPGIEVKGEGGYVAVPCGRNDRGWLDPVAPLVPASAELLTWLKSTQRSERRSRAGPAQPIPEGSRHNALVSLAGTMRTRPEFDADAIDAALQVVNRKLCVPPHDEREIRRIAESAASSWEPSVPSAEAVVEVQRIVRGWLR